MNNLKEVSYEEFYAVVGLMDVCPNAVGRYPYTSIFKTRAGREVGRVEEAVAGEPSRYFLVTNIQGTNHE